MRKKEFLDRDKRRIKKLYESGKSTKEIGETFNCSKTPILRILNSMEDVSVRDNKNKYRNEKLRKNIPKGKLKELYNKKEKTIEEIAQILNVSNFTVQKRMRKYDIEGDHGRNQRVLTEGNKEEIVKMYKNGLSVYDISENFPVSARTIQKWLKKRGVELTGNVNIPQIRENESFGYVMGVLNGDGSLSNNTLSLKVIDKDFSNSFAKAVEDFSSLSPFKYQYTKTRTGNPVYEVSLNSVKVSKFLKQYDLEDIKNKEEKIISAFIRGFFDSDGTLSKDNVRFYNGDKKLLEFTKELLDEIGIPSLDILKDKNKRNNFYLFHIQKKFSSKFRRKVGSEIKRKREKINKICDDYGN